jgi:hypothetical protein
LNHWRESGEQLNAIREGIEGPEQISENHATTCFRLEAKNESWHEGESGLPAPIRSRNSATNTNPEPADGLAVRPAIRSITWDCLNCFFFFD